MRESKSLLRLEKISKKFNANYVLKNVDFAIQPGEVHALVGENGAGKSTLIKIISGVYTRDKGKIFYNDSYIDLKTPHEALDFGISTIHQEFNLVPFLDAPSNIYLGREVLGKLGILKKKEMKERAENILNQIGYNMDLDRPINKLSVAEQQIIEICKALSLNIKLLIMDEPTAVLSDKETQKLFEIVNALKRRGIAIIYISHRLEELFSIADRTTVLRDGCVVETLERKDFEKSKITKLMIGREISEQYPKNINRKKGDKLLEISGVNGGFLKDVSFDLHEGEILGISGLVGAGRTELAKAIIGAYPIGDGKIRLKGKEIINCSPAHALKNGIAMVPEDRKNQGLMMNLNNEENLTISNLKMFSTQGVLDKKSIKEYAIRIIDDLNVRPNEVKKRTKELSGGNQQKVVIGKWLTKDYAVMIFDEPTRGVDVGAKVEIYNILTKIADSGIGVIMISSELPEIIGMSDRIIVLHEGKVTVDLQNEELSEEDVIKYAFK